MIWNNPWALVGLATLAVPVLVHLLGRRQPTPLQRLPAAYPWHCSANWGAARTAASSTRAAPS